MKKRMKQKHRCLLLVLGMGVGIYGLSHSLLPQSASAADIRQDQRSLAVSRIDVEGNREMGREDILRLLPVLSNERVSVDELSRQIQLVNETQAVKLKADFKPDHKGAFYATVSVEELQRDHHILSLNNTGNDYTGDWRFSYTYLNTNLSRRADTLGVAAVTAPGHFSDVKQAALFYRRLLPQAGGSLYASYSYSDVNLGQIANFGGLSMNATGKGQSYGLHYQKNLAYTAGSKELLDFGIDHKDYRNAQNYAIDGVPLLRQGADFTVTTLGMTYINSRRSANEAASYSLGYVANINRGREEYAAYRLGSDKQFGIVKAGFNYQRKLAADWIGTIRLQAQYSRDNLLTTEQIGAGGAASVRGFDERAVSADNGYVANLEMYSPEVAKGQRFVVFSDIGHLYNNRANTGELDNDTVASVGVGYRYTDASSGWSGLIDYAYVVDDIETKSHQDSGKVHVAVSKKF